MRWRARGGAPARRRERRPSSPVTRLLANRPMLVLLDNCEHVPRRVRRCGRVPARRPWVHHPRARHQPGGAAPRWRASWHRCRAWPALGRRLRRWRERCVSSKPAHGRRTAFALDDPNAPPSRLSGGWTVCRWRSSWPPRGCATAGRAAPGAPGRSPPAADRRAERAPPPDAAAALDWSHDLLSDRSEQLCSRELPCSAGGSPWALSRR